MQHTQQLCRPKLGTIPVTNNTLADFFDGLVKASIVGGEVAAEAFIASDPYTSWLETPLIAALTNEFISAFANSIYKQAGMVVANTVISVQTNLEESAVANAVNALNKAKSSGDLNAISAATTAYDSAIISLVYSDGSASPA